jgi:beta-lactamase regulating signal transducer with metallopeptidase domain/Tol biopolymer transport system component
MSVHAFNLWSASATALGAAILSQSTLLACLVAGVSWLLRRSTPALRYWCWQIVALKLLLMPWWMVAMPLPGFSDEVGVSPVAAKTTENREVTLGAAMESVVAPPAGEARFAANETRGWSDFLGRLNWHSWLVVAWLSGIAWQVGCILIQRGRLRRLLSRATAVAEPRLLAVFQEVAAQLDLSHRPALVLSDEAGGPFVYGLVHPVLVLPRSLMADLARDNWREVLLHELSHLKRRDLWWGWLPALARIVYFFHPVAHWVCFRIRLERELACDQLAVALSGRSAADYAEVLVQVAAHASLPAALTMNSVGGITTFWKRRLNMLLSASRSSPQLSRRATLSIVSAAILVCLLPTIERAPAQTNRQLTGPDAKAKGRIYVSASLRLKSAGQKEEKTQHSMLIAIDPETDKWQKVTDRGHSGRVSPDGRTLVFASLGDGIGSCDTAGTNSPRKISDTSGRPIWSPDGKRLVVTKQVLVEKDSDKKPRTVSSWKDETWSMASNGRDVVKLPIPDTDSVDDWSPDGQWFVTSSDRHPPYGSGYQLYLMKTDGTQERRLTHGGLNVYARFSPDGKKILYLRQTAKAGNSIWTMDIDGKNAKEIVKEVDLASPDGAYWSPDGKQIAVILFNWELDAKGERTLRIAEQANYRIEIMDADGTNRRQLKLHGATFVFIGSLGDWR